MIKQIVNTFFVKILSGVLNLAIAIIISNYLGAEGKGLQGIILTTISLIVIFAGIVGSGGLTYLLPRMRFALLIIPSYLWTIVVISLLWISLKFTEIVPSEYVNHIIAISFAATLLDVNNSILYAKKQIYRVNFAGIIQVITTLSIILYLFLIKNELSVSSYIIALYSGFGLSVVISFWFTRKYYVTNYKFSSHRYWIGIINQFKYGSFNQLDILAQVLTFRLAYYFLNYFSSVSDVGIYSNAVAIIESVWLLSRSIAFVQHSVIVNSRDKNYKGNLTVTFIKLAGILALFAIVVLVFIPESFYKFVFGDEFGLMRVAILSLSPGVLFFSISFIISAYLSGVGKHHINSISSISGLLTIIIFSLFLIPKYGIVGAGISASMAYFITTLIKLYNFCRINQFSLLELIPSKKDVRIIRDLIIKKNASN
jgi:O-antigen/teichoic acid export membrane protein